jgi:hypothetical protein
MGEFIFLAGAGFDPNRKSGDQICCDAQRGISYDGVVECNFRVEGNT